MAEESGVVAEAVETPVAEAPAEVKDEGTTESKQEAPDGLQETEGKKETVESAEAKPVEKRKYKYKAAGKEIEAELSDDDIVKALAKAAGADASFQEAAKVKNQIMQLLEEGAKSPEQLLKMIKVDPRKFAEELLYKIYSEEQMPEAERRALQAERRAAELEAEKKALEEEHGKAQFDAEVNKYKDEFDKRITEALATAEVKIPRTPDTVKRISGYLMKLYENTAQSVDNGWIDMDGNVKPEAMKEIVQIVHNDIKGGIGEVLGNADEDTLIKMLGEDKARAIAKKIAMAAPTPENRATQETKPDGSKKSNSKKTWKELEAELDRTLGK